MSRGSATSHWPPNWTGWRADIKVTDCPAASGEAKTPRSYSATVVTHGIAKVV
jgi:hypothetical protein